MFGGKLVSHSLDDTIMDIDDDCFLLQCQIEESEKNIEKNIQNIMNLYIEAIKTNKASNQIKDLINKIQYELNRLNFGIE